MHAIIDCFYQDSFPLRIIFHKTLPQIVLFKLIVLLSTQYVQPFAMTSTLDIDLGENSERVYGDL